MCTNMPAPILGQGQDDADQPNSRCRAVKRERCLCRIEHHSLTLSSPSSDTTQRLPHRSSTIQAGIRETTKTVHGNEDVDTTGRKSNKTVHSYPHRHLNPKNSHGRGSAPATRLHSRWNSSSRAIVDKPPSQPLSCRQLSRGTSSTVSVKESQHHKDPNTTEVRRLQHSDSMWTSGGAGITNERPPLRRGKAFRGLWASGGAGTTNQRPPLRRRRAFKRFHHGACRWSSSSRAALDRAPSQAPAPHRMIVGLSIDSAPKPSVEMKDGDIFKMSVMALCIFNMSGKPPASLKSPERCRIPMPIVSTSA
jgi:hypothetical protein